MRKACIVGLLGALVALALACGSSEEEKAAATPSPAGSQATPEVLNERHTPEKKAARLAAQTPAQIKQGELPESFPSDIPVYPDSQPKTSMMVGGSGLFLLTSTAPVADVLAHYREQLASQGWTVDGVTEGAGGTKASVKAHKDTRQATVSITQAKDGAGTEIGIALKGSS